MKVDGFKDRLGNIVTSQGFQNSFPFFMLSPTWLKVRSIIYTTYTSFFFFFLAKEYSTCYFIPSLDFLLEKLQPSRMVV